MPAKTRPDRREAMTPQVEEGDNTRYLSYSMQVAELPAIDTDDAEQVWRRTMEYFEVCRQHDMKPSVAGLALSYGVDRSTMNRWVNGVTHKPAAVCTTIKKALAVLNVQMEDYMQNGKINPVAGIFLMKNNMGYRDQQDVVVAPERKEAPPEEVLIAEAELLDD